MWCKSCQHGHNPVLRVINNIERSLCPCCGAELSDKTVKTKEDMVLEYAKQHGVDVSISKQSNVTVIGHKPEEPDANTTTTDTETYVKVDNVEPAKKIGRPKKQ